MGGALDGVYTRMLRVALNVSWKDHITNVNLYGKLPRLSDKIRQRRMRLAGHCVRHLELSACELILWEPTYGKLSRGRPQTTYVDTLKRDTGLSSVSELQTLMKDREQWRAALNQMFPSWCWLTSSHRAHGRGRSMGGDNSTGACEGLGRMQGPWRGQLDRGL